MSNQQNPAPTRHFPVRPDLDQLKHQAKDLLRRIRRGDSEGLAEFTSFHPNTPQQPAEINLADAQLVLARSYGASSWPRMVQSCKLIDAIWCDDLNAVKDLVTKHPKLLHENAGIRNGNWGPPLTYAANLGRDRIIKMLYDLGARDLETAMDAPWPHGPAGKTSPARSTTSAKNLHARRDLPARAGLPRRSACDAGNSSGRHDTAAPLR